MSGGEAKPAVWANWADFSKRMNEFTQKINEAAQTAKGKGQDAALANILDVLTCKSCHKVWRQGARLDASHHAQSELLHRTAECGIAISSNSR
jgi:hypothetical protein